MPWPWRACCYGGSLVTAFGPVLCIVSLQLVPHPPNAPLLCLRVPLRHAPTLPALPSLQGLPARSPPPSWGACPAPCGRAPPGSGALWRGSRGALGGTEEPYAQWGGRGDAGAGAAGG